MIKLEKKQVKIISILIALVFIGSVVALALTQTGGIASAASSGAVGVVDRQQIFTQHPDLESADNQLKAFYEELQNDLKEKSAGMSHQEKQDYAAQCQQRFQQRQRDLLDPIMKSIDAAVKKIADNKGLAVVIAKDAVVYGGQDITDDVVKEITKK